jgi:hypothetical protein
LPLAAQSGTSKEVAPGAVLLRVRVRHWWRARKKHRIRAEAIATTRKALGNAKKVNAGASRAVFNVGLYLLLIDQDLADFTDDMVNAVGVRRRRFVAKHEAVLLYEAAEDLPQLLGKGFRDAAGQLGASPDKLHRLNSASSSLHRFWETHREFLGTIRKALAAHREHDALVYEEQLEALDPLEVMRLAAEFSGLLEGLIGVLVEIAELTLGMRAILDDMSRTSRTSG